MAEGSFEEIVGQDRQHSLQYRKVSRTNVSVSIHSQRTLERYKHWTISIMNHLTNIILRIITNTIRNVIRPEIAIEQYGYSRNFGRRRSPQKVLEVTPLHTLSSRSAPLVSYDSINSNMKFAAAILLLALIAVQTSEAIKCYQCNVTGDCKAEVECSGSCTNTTTTTAGVSTTVRACSPGKIDNGCKDTTLAGVPSSACACDTDLCNTGVASHVAIPLMIGAVLLGRFM
ncbi:uncharacterized protein LOC134765257 [Penaeus indicus]|uniref:uncharacterized protein LOC134765257 n=1 Tax=Penaeus indicus TaxID=29960 RepID=UPI00300DACEE